MNTAHVLLGNKTLSLLRPRTPLTKIRICNMTKPHQPNLIEKLESVQNKATRFILKNYTRTSNTKLKNELDISLLAE